MPPAAPPGPARLMISQADHFAGNFGEVLRSSAIFYYRRTADFQTVISFMDYWKAKRGLDVAVIASTRDLTGALVRRQRLTFERGAVINYRPEVPEPFEGSVEIEVFSTRNMVIPYSAIMAVYRSRRGLSMVHSYARTYSRHEVEERRTISVGEEACWTLRDDARTRSFCVFHNGGSAQVAQQVTVGVRNAAGETREAVLDLPALEPYATVKLHPGDHLRGLAAFLAGQPGQGRLSFRLSESFTRMLVGNESVDGGDFQATHSNFNYARHQTDAVDGDHVALMKIPRLGGLTRAVLVYPDSDPGRYEVEVDGRRRAFASGDALTLPIEGAPCLAFRKSKGTLPTRIVTALVCEAGGERIPAECSLGVTTHLQPKKRLWWGLGAEDDQRSSWLVAHDVPEIHGGLAASDSFSVRLFSSTRADHLERTFPASALPMFEDGVSLRSIFPDAPAFLGGDYGYYTVFSEYGGLTCYSYLRDFNGGFALEHGF